MLVKWRGTNDKKCVCGMYVNLYEYIYDTMVCVIFFILILLEQNTLCQY